jgi:hypothetical protein
LLSAPNFLAMITLAQIADEYRQSKISVLCAYSTSQITQKES